MEGHLPSAALLWHLRLLLEESRLPLNIPLSLLQGQSKMILTPDRFTNRQSERMTYRVVQLP